MAKPERTSPRPSRELNNLGDATIQDDRNNQSILIMDTDNTASKPHEHSSDFPNNPLHGSIHLQNFEPELQTLPQPDLINISSLLHKSHDFSEPAPLDL